jgi:hypothetical protein
VFDSNAYGAHFTPLLAEARLNELGPGRPHAEAGPMLKALTAAQAFEPHAIKDRHMANACLAGIWLYHDYLDESHALSQSIPTSTGSYWHAIMHRREPDSWNSKYWLDRVGRHPVFPALREAARTLAAGEASLPETRFIVEQSPWDPYRFVDLCEACRTGKSTAEALCRQIQLEEWRLLFDFCYRQAIGI